MEQNGFQKAKEIVLFTLDEPRYALPVTSVERVVRIVEITPLPRAPDIVMGVINVQGQVLPVINVRRRFHLPEHKMRLDECLIIAQSSRHRVALVVDSIEDVRRLDERDVVVDSQILPYAGFIAGVVKLEQGLFFICDLDQFLSLDEESVLDQALSSASQDE